MNNNNNDNNNIKKSSVEKRKETILKKRQMKEQRKEVYHNKRYDKYILQAGEVYNEEKSNISDKFKLSDVKYKVRERKFKEKNIDKSAINGMFQIKTIDDNNLNIVTKEKNLTIISPNYTYIKNRLSVIFNNEISTNNKNLKIVSYITFKYCVDPSSILELPISPQDIRYYNSNIVLI